MAVGEKVGFGAGITHLFQLLNYNNQQIMQWIKDNPNSNLAPYIDQNQQICKMLQTEVGTLLPGFKVPAGSGSAVSGAVGTAPRTGATRSSTGRRTRSSTATKR